MKTKTKNTIFDSIGTIGMIVIALALGAVLIAVSGNNVGEAFAAILKGAFGSTSKITELFVKLCPILLMAFGVSIAFKGSLWNIGAEGQFIMGSIASVAVALYVPVPFVIRIPLSFIAAIAAGALWAGLAAWLKNRFNANEVITTLMLTYVAKYLNMWLINGPMQDPESDLSQTALVPKEMYLKPLLGDTYRLNSGIFILLIVVILMFFFWKTSIGYRIDLMGQGEKVSTYAGINVKRTVVMTMMISGGLCALAGWIEMFGIQYRLLDGLAADYSNIATIIALLGNLKVVGIIISACFFSILLCGGASMQRMTEVPYSIVNVMEGLIIVFVIAKNVVSQRMIQVSTRNEMKVKEKELKAKEKEEEERALKEAIEAEKGGDLTC